jgi:hypothetical protein
LQHLTGTTFSKQQAKNNPRKNLNAGKDIMPLQPFKHIYFLT